MPGGLGRFLPAVLGGDLSARPNLAQHGYTLSPNGDVVFPNMDLGGAGLSFHNPAAYEVSGAGDVAMPPPVSFQPRDADLSLRNLGQYVGPAADAMDYVDVVEGIRNRDPLRAGLGMAGIGVPMLGGLGGMVKAYHGSPHVFDAFDASKIGTGEGAQAFGHGLYFAENPEIAGNYRNTLAYDPEKIRIKGIQINDFYNEINNRAARMPIKEAQKEYDKMQVIEAMMQELPTDDIARQADELGIGDWYRNEVEPNFESYGALYDVELDVEPEDLLDWDAPLSEQSAKVREALQRIADTNPNVYDDPIGMSREMKEFETPEEARVFWDKARKEWFDTPNRKDRYKPRLLSNRKIEYSPPNARAFGNATGGQIMDVLWRTGGSQEGASAALNNAGVPGLRYLDAGSRSTEKGTRNVVMFPGTEDKIKITGRK